MKREHFIETTLSVYNVYVVNLVSRYKCIRDFHVTCFVGCSVLLNERIKLVKDMDMYQYITVLLALYI